jgi:rRNA maturation RNase YbeY
MWPSARERRLNRTYRGRDYATNVLTFIYETRPLAGDVVICAPVVARERAHRQDIAAHQRDCWSWLLHLQGYDHERSDARVRAAQLEGRERALLRPWFPGSLRGRRIPRGGGVSRFLIENSHFLSRLPA